MEDMTRDLTGRQSGVVTSRTKLDAAIYSIVAPEQKCS